MAEPLETTLKIDGLQEIGAAFQRLAQAADNAFKAIETSAGAASKGVEKIDPAIKKVEDSFKRLAQSVGVTVGPLGSLVSNVGNLGTALDGLKGAFGNFLKNTTLFAAAVAGVGIGFGKLVSSAAHAADDLQETAQGVGLSADAFQTLSAAASDAGVGPENFGIAISKLAKAVKSELQPTLKQAGETISRLNFAPGAAGARAYEKALSVAAARTELLNNATGKAVGPIGDLGVRLIDAQGNLKGVDEILLDVADAFSKMPDGIQKTALSMELFSRGGRKMVAFLNQGKEAIQKLGSELAALKFSDEQLKVGDKFAQQMLRLELIIKGVKNQIGIMFAPSFGDAASALADRILSSFEDMRLKLFVIFKNEIEPILEDFVRLLKGEPVQTQWVKEAEANFRAFGATVKQALDIVVAAFGALRAGAQGIATVINGVFGTNVSGDALLVAAAILKVTGALGLLGAAVVVASSALRVLLSVLVVISRAAVALGATMAAAFAIPLAPVLAALAGIVVAFALTTDTGRKIFGLFLNEIVKMVADTGPKIGAAIKDWFKSDLGLKPDESIFDWSFISRGINREFEAVLQNASRVWENIKRVGMITWEGWKTFISSGGNPFETVLALWKATTADIKKEAVDTGKDVGPALAPPQEIETLWDKVTKTIGLSVEEVRKKFPQLAAAFDLFTGKTKTAADATKSLAAGLKDPTKGLEDLGKAGKKAGGEISAAMSQAKSAVEALDKQIEQVDEQLQQLQDKREGVAEGPAADEVKQQRLEEKRDKLLGQRNARQAEFDHARNIQAQEEFDAEQKAIQSNAAQEKALREAAFADRMRQLDEIEQRQKRTGETTPGIGIDVKAPGAAPEPPKAVEQVQQATQGLQQALAQFTQQAQALVQTAIQQISQAISTGLTTGITEALAQFTQQLTEQLAGLAQQIGQVFGDVGGAISQAFSDAGAAKDAFIQNLDNLIQKGSELGGLTQSIDAIGQAFQNVGQAKDALIQGLSEMATAAQGLSQPFTQAASDIGAAFQEMAQQISSAVSQSISMLNQLAQAARDAASAVKGIGGGAGDIGGGGGDIFAGNTGGLLRGKEGIDKNMGLFTAGEYLMQRKATKFWGVGFMHMVNNMRKVDLARTLAGSVRGFNLGGLVEGMARSVPMPAPAMALASKPQVVTVRVPAYQQGGEVHERRVAIDLKLGGQMIGTVHTSERTAAHLERLSSHAKVVSTGNPPNWRR